MNISKHIRSQITAADFESCWSSTTPAPYSDFIDFACKAFEKQLPNDFSDLTVGISPGLSDNRVDLNGKFTSDATIYEICGAIVWLPDMNMFRGRPVINKSLDNISKLELEHVDEITDVKTRTLAELNETEHFETWDYPSQSAIQASRAVLRDTVIGLIKLGDRSKISDRISIIKRCIESFNKINEQFDNFIDTDIREKIIDKTYEIALAAGLDSEIADQLDEWRDW